jgi:hypothetical protein
MARLRVTGSFIHGSDDKLDLELQPPLNLLGFSLEIP